ncbi:hypothetical protein D3C74_415680 [compost metagenome]
MPSLKKSSAAISLLVWPSAIKDTTASSALVSPYASKVLGIVSFGGAAGCRKPASLRAMSGWMSRLPSCTVLIPWIIRSGGIFFSKYPLAPFRSASIMYSSSSKVVSISTEIPGKASLMDLVPSTPSQFGIRISISTTSA